MSNLDEFRALGLSEQMLSAIAAKGFETPSPIQRLTIPVLLKPGNDIIAQAQTGTGKTAAFGLPVLEMLAPSKAGAQALVLAPTRELALQVSEELLSFNHRRLSIASIYGGAAMSEQLRRLQKGIDVVVGTPGRILDHIRRGTLSLSNLKYLILDEADEMLNMGFIEDVEEIMAAADERRRVLLFSATMPKRIADLAGKYMREVEHLKVEAQLTVDLTDQIYFEVREGDKFDALTRIIDVEAEFYGIVFSRTKIGVDEMVNRLLERGYAAEGLHGDVSQAQREKILKKFRKKQANILVATDVAARGIDIDNLTHVINYSLPQDSESYVHRIGRTGRAGRQGTAITFISPSEMRGFGWLKRDIKADITKATLPTPQDVIATKRARIKDDLNEIIENANYEEYMEMANELLAGHPAPVAMSALLRLAFRNELSESNFPEIRTFSVDRRGKARLFISIGRLDGYDARKMVELLKRECKLSDSKIDDVKVMDAYSFVTVPYEEAEHAVRQLNALRKGGDRPLAEIAQEKGAAGGNGDFEGKPRFKSKVRENGGDKFEKRDKFEKHDKPARKPKAAPAEDQGVDMGDFEQFVRPAKAAKTEKPAKAERKGEHKGAASDGYAKPKAKAEPKAKTESKAKAEKTAKVEKPAAKPAATDENPKFSAGGFDWAAFEAALPGNWEDRPGKGKTKKAAAKPVTKAGAKAGKNMTIKVRSKR